MKKIILLACLLITACDDPEVPTEGKALATRDNDYVGTSVSRMRLYCRHGWQLIVNIDGGMTFDRDGEGSLIPCNQNKGKQTQPDKPRL
jgi:hypothetical protein